MPKIKQQTCSGMKTVAARLRKLSRIFCKSMLCKKNVKRDLKIIFVVVIFFALFIQADRYFYNKKIQDARKNIVPATKPLPRQNIFGKENTLQNSNASLETIGDNKPAPQTATSKTIVSKITNPQATGASCIKIPANILAGLKNAPPPPDGKMKNGKLICDVLAKGKKDHPHKSSKNPKGAWGGCCYDPDETPNPACCYPVGSVYEKSLNAYFKNPFPLKK